jgi:hypothetical protein
LYLESLEERCLLAAYTPGPLLLLSNPDPLAGCPPGFLGANVAVEPYVAVNPANPNNLAAIWIDHGFAGNAVGVTLDGGTTWQNESLPGTTQCTGGTNPAAADPWLSFAPNGDLYAIGDSLGKNVAALLVNKSTDGGLTWSNPIQVDTTGNPARDDDKPSLTADPTNANFVYATWSRTAKSSVGGNNAETMFARSTDGGQTWQPEQSIHQAPGTDINWGHQIVVLPDGTLIDAFSEGGFANNHQVTLTLLRSSDHGQTWSAPITAAVQEPLADHNLQPPSAVVTDPDTGQLVEAHPFPSLAVDRSSGTLYAAWLDARFSNFQHNGIALAMSSDGGFTWSNPIPVNQTPANVPSADQQAWSPAVAVAADGTVAISYYDFRNNTPAAGALTDYWMAFCRPSATTPVTNPGSWGEVRLTDTSFNLEQAPTRFNGAFFLGDYEGLAAVGKDFVAAWGMPDGTSTAQESIFFRRLQAAPGPQAPGVAAPAPPPHGPVPAADLGSALRGLTVGTPHGFGNESFGPAALNGSQGTFTNNEPAVDLLTGRGLTPPPDWLPPAADHLGGPQLLDSWSLLPAGSRQASRSAHGAPGLRDGTWADAGGQAAAAATDALLAELAEGRATAP